MTAIKTFLLVLFSLTFITPSLSSANPEEPVTREELRKIQNMLNKEVQSGAIPGYVALVSYKDKAYILPGGYTAFDHKTQMSPDQIFRISSMSKPLTVIAALQIIEAGKIQLEDPVSNWIPEFAGLQVLNSVESAITDTTPLNRPVTVRDLLTSTFGSGMIMTGGGPYPIQDELGRRGLGDGPPQPLEKLPPDEFIRRFTELPLMAQPGEEWHYHRAVEILSVLIPKVTGQSLQSYFEAHILNPLKMKDTSFVVPHSKIDRLTPSYIRDPATKEVIIFDDPKQSQWAFQPNFESGTDGMVSTVSDYYRLAKMLLQNGNYRGNRILSAKWVQQMTTNQLSSSQLETFDPTGTHGFGYGLLVNLTKGLPGEGLGQYGWSGGLGTYWFNDPESGLIGILMTPMAQETPDMPERVIEFNKLVHEVLKN